MLLKIICMSRVVPATARYPKIHQDVHRGQLLSYMLADSYFTLVHNKSGTKIIQWVSRLGPRDQGLDCGANQDTISVPLPNW